ncbi:MAG: DUF1329 domain-containing protein [Glaciimonas sp.]|nr:DUF1329 domain-containing protein [Glaciimonas sp.]
MKTSSKFMARSLLAASVLVLGTASAAPSAQDIAHLGKDLTPVGAEKAGNADGSIPAWAGGLTSSPAGFDPQKGYIDPFAAEKPLFVITGSNADQYKDKLTAGHYAMLKKYGTFKMNVYPTHRTAAYPQEIYDSIKKNAGAAQLTGEEITCSGCVVVPFPFAQSGRQVMWNHLYRWRGAGIARDTTSAPVLADGSILYYNKPHMTWAQRADFSDQENVPVDLVSAFTFFQKAPAQVEGRAGVVKSYANPSARPLDFYFYNTGLRRVRKMPQTPNDYFDDALEGLRTADQFDGFFGSLVSYDFKLVGKKEILVPYNSYKLADRKLKYQQILSKNHLNPDYLRFEKHRVWVVDGTLRANQRHIYSKRTWYIDEDSWTVLHDDAYDSRGQLWRVNDVHTMQFYNVPVPYIQTWSISDLNSGAYITEWMDNEETTPIRFGVKSRWSDYSAEGLKRMGTK